MNIWLRRTPGIAVLVGVILFSARLPSKANAEELFQLRNGMTLRGTKAEIASLNANAFSAAAAGEIKLRPIWVIDDGLTRIYFHGNGMSAAPPVAVRDIEQTIEFWQPTPLGGKEISAIGSILGVSPFNEFGRRVMTVRGVEGSPMRLVQGVTEINGRYARVQGLKGETSYVWDMRLATSSLKSDVLKSIFRRRMDWDNLDKRLEAVRFFMEAGRYGDAIDILKEAIDDFPEAAKMQRQVVALTERQATQLLDEAKLRAESGQEELALQILEQFPIDQLGRVTKLQVEDAIEKIRGSQQQAKSLIEQLDGQIAQLKQAQALQPIFAEIKEGLSSATMIRLSDYIRLGQSEAVPLENRVALAVAGWLLGSGSGEQNLTITISLVTVRDLVAEYLATSDAARRQAILSELRNLEGAEAEYVDRMLPLLTPTLPWPEGSQHETISGMHVVGDETEQLDQPPRPRYVIQLPPNYDPLREYPCVLALHPVRGTPVSEIDWWSGVYNEEMQARLGHASRYGFIVVAPLWTRDTQGDYEYSSREHERVLVSLRDAMRRSSIDADRIFIAGHGEGGAAAWDIAYSHPDLWAGMISISGEPAKTIMFYHSNAPYVPMYLVMGERDGAPTPLVRNGPVMDDYVKFKSDAMVVMYRGRGREFFYEEIHRLFEWMRLPSHVRKDAPDEIDAVTMREGDTFFWWLELGALKPDVAVDPLLWEQAERPRAASVSASIGNDNQIRINQGPTEQFRVWLRPMRNLDMAKPVTIRYRTRRVLVEFDGSLETMLEDARRRADRKRAFWVGVNVP
ncbi:alpha/beta hydrolase [Novipirellula sp. SH528]|uniref:alpha/beta hydrolase n=1 Tax=Novipirellula sp. SH528 TaxID=3454466 RepID=UPI003FA020A5